MVCVVSSPARLLWGFIAGDGSTQLEIKPKENEADENCEYAEDMRAMLGKRHNAGGSVAKALLECNYRAPLEKHKHSRKEK
jgi:hypothetical protein